MIGCSGLHQVTESKTDENGTMPDLGESFISESRTFLTDDYLPKIRIAVGHLSEEDLWWTPNPVSNSVGNLLLHLSGNLRQWVVSGLGGAPDGRDRELEFDPVTHPAREALLDRVTRAAADADAVLAALDPERLLAMHTIQGREVTGLRALSHAVEHLGMKTGQIRYGAKLRSGEKLGFYEVVDGIPRERWNR